MLLPESPRTAIQSSKNAIESLTQAKIKTIPEDFIVEEITGPDRIFPSKAKSGKQHLKEANYDEILLTKSGFTTFEAVDLIASTLKLNKNQVGYSGLKDEDAVTKQRITIPTGALKKSLTITKKHGTLTVTKLGERKNSLDVGDLIGNTFMICLRNLNPLLTSKLPDPGVYQTEFINYYDTQRFGIPGGPYNTHEIGKHLEQNEHEAALELLKTSNAAEGKKARNFSGKPLDFFNALDPRIIAFYRSSFHSYEWNENVSNIVQQSGKFEKINREGILYYFPLVYTPDIAYNSKYTTVRIINGLPRKIRRNRILRVGLTVSISERMPDELNPGKELVKLKFFLPSGCYATMAVTQFLHQQLHNRECSNDKED